MRVRRVRTTAESRCCMRPRSTEALPPLTQELRSAPGSACLSPPSEKKNILGKRVASRRRIVLLHASKVDDKPAERRT
ncbi:hypothetical protein TNCT_79121 [Trichonephila clavata]|uniref:Uncharacterized protein n=1 Tax=Trichonephila clavata TaxID=2740835 RepID=A0A8X6EZT3_TRICU|nr:hypothetical protein TNCT_79121 [Trichonephila clavata]